MRLLSKTTLIVLKLALLLIYKRLQLLFLNFHFLFEHHTLLVNPSLDLSYFLLITQQTTSLIFNAHQVLLSSRVNILLVSLFCAFEFRYLGYEVLLLPSHALKF